MSAQALTVVKNKPYNPFTANALAVGFSDLNGQNNGATAPCNSLGVFLCLKGFPLVVCEGNPQGLPVKAVGVRRFANPSHAATIIFSEIWCQLVLNQTQDTNMTDKVTAYMPEDCYAIRPEVDKTKLYDPIILTLERASALVCLMEDNGQDLEEGFTIGHSAIMHLLHGVSADLKAATHLMESWDFTKAGETH